MSSVTRGSYCFAAVAASFSFLAMILALLGSQMHTVDGLSIVKSPFESGYGHGCSDADITDFSDRYINQPGKGPNFHTDEFMLGYDRGFNACS